MSARLRLSQSRAPQNPKPVTRWTRLLAPPWLYAALVVDSGVAG